MTSQAKTQPTSWRKLAELTFVEMMRTLHVLQQSQTELFKQHGVTPAQYNILRILRGAAPEALSCGTISERMITSDSDITRILDRLDKLGYISRSRDTKDRRVVKTAINDEGLKLLEQMDEVVLNYHESNFKKLSYGELELLRSLLVRASTR